MLKYLHDASLKLEEYIVPSITTEVISKVAVVLRAAESVGIRVDSLDQPIREIHEVKEHNELVQNINMLQAREEEVKSN